MHALGLRKEPPHSRVLHESSEGDAVAAGGLEESVVDEVDRPRPPHHEQGENVDDEEEGAQYVQWGEMHGIVHLHNFFWASTKSFDEKSDYYRYEEEDEEVVYEVLVH